MDRLADDQHALVLAVIETYFGFVEQGREIQEQVFPNAGDLGRFCRAVEPLIGPLGAGYVTAYAEAHGVRRA